MSLASDTILLVEDDTNDIRLLQRTFGRFNLGKQIRTVESGEMAIAYLDGQEPFADREQFPLPTVVFLDLKLPGISGFEVLAWIRQQLRLAKTQVVVLTGSQKSLDVYRAYELGANSYLVKPVREKDIVGLAKGLNLPWLALAKKRNLAASDAASVDAPPAQA